MNFLTSNAKHLCDDNNTDHFQYIVYLKSVEHEKHK
jgi:hypothetical protein